MIMAVLLPPTIRTYAQTIGRSIPQRGVNWMRQWTLEAGDAVALVVLTIAAIAIHQRFFAGEVILGHDTVWHSLWINHFSQQIRDGIVYPRWLADTNYGYGSPTFVFYPPLPYYLAHLFKGIAQWPIAQTYGGVYTLISLLSGLSVYGYKRRAWGRIAALIAGLFFLLAPYNLYDRYMRMALSSAVAALWLPLGLWMTDLAVERPRWRWGVASVSAGLVLTNVPSLLLFNLLWWPYTIAAHYRRGLKTLMLTLVSIAIGWGMAGFFLVPVVFERQLTGLSIAIKGVSGGAVSNLVGSNSPDSFVQYILSSITKMWLMEAFSFTVAAIGIIAMSYRTGHGWRSCLGLLIGFSSVAFLTHTLSAFVWNTIEILRYAQFPWRLLTLLSLITALSIGLLLHRWRDRTGTPQIVILTVAIALLWLRTSLGAEFITTAPSIQHPTWYSPEDTGRAWLAAEKPFARLLEDAYEYQPTTAEPPRRYAPEVWFDGDTTIDRWDAYDRRILTVSTQPATLTLRLYCYPAWKIKRDGQAIPLNCSEAGVVTVAVPAGNHAIELHYGWTIAAIWGVIVSALSLGLMTKLGSIEHQ